MTAVRARDRDPLPDFDLYTELGIPLDASRDMVEAAWRERVHEAHPDLAGASGGSAWRTRTWRAPRANPRPRTERHG